MASSGNPHQKDNKPFAKKNEAGVVPQAASAPRRTMSDISGVGVDPRRSISDLSGFSSEPRRPAGPVPSLQSDTRRSTGVLPAVDAEAPKRATAQHAIPTEAAAVPSIETPKIKTLTEHQKGLLGSAFGDSTASRKRSTLLGSDAGKSTASTEPQSVSKVKYDGTKAPAFLSNRDLWKAAEAPVQNREGHRSKDHLTQVLNQFAVGNNPRYDPDAPGKYRSHIFVWDVSRAMGCEIPHFVGAKELSLPQTCDWLRHEGPMRQWRRIDIYEVIGAANQGVLVVAMPKDIKIKFLGVVPPQPPTDDMRPLIMCAALQRGTGKILEMFGIKQAEFFVHA